MARRKKLTRRKSRKMFKKTVRRVHPRNVLRRPSMRGGIRM